MSKLVLKNFQTHKRLEIELDRYVTSIVGSTDAGKTTILRALYWLCFNRPSGEAFIRSGSKFTRVELHLDNQVIIRSKGKKNLYKLDDQEYVSFGQSVPDTVAAFLNVSEVNFQQQLDPPFWFSLSPGEVSKQLNSIVNLGLIDKTLANLHLKKHRAKEKVRFTEERLNKAKLQVLRFKWVEKASRELERIEKLENGIAQKRARIACIASVSLQARNALETHRKLSKAAEEVKKSDLKQLDGIYERYEDVKQRISDLGGLISSLRKLGEEECQTRRECTLLKDQLKTMIPSVCPMCGGATKKKS